MMHHWTNEQLARWLLENPTFWDNYRICDEAVKALCRKAEHRYCLPRGMGEELLCYNTRKPWRTEAEAFQLIEQFFRKNGLTRSRMPEFDMAKRYARYFRRQEDGQFRLTSDVADWYVILFLSYASGQPLTWDEADQQARQIDLSKKSTVGAFSVRRYKNGRLDLTAPHEAMARFDELQQLAQRPIRHPVTDSLLRW
jgi:hypothetical protein